MTDGRQVSEHFLCFLVTSRRSRLFWKQWAADLDKKTSSLPCFCSVFSVKTEPKFTKFDLQLP